MKPLFISIFLCLSLGAFAQRSLTVVGVTGANPTFATQNYTSGSTVTVSNDVDLLIVNPSSTIASLVVTLPASPSDRQQVTISFGGTITNGTVITSLTISPNSGHTIIQSSTPGTSEAGESISYRFTNSKWYRL